MSDIVSVVLDLKGLAGGGIQDVVATANLSFEGVDNFMIKVQQFVDQLTEDATDINFAFHELNNTISRTQQRLEKLGENITINVDVAPGDNPKNKTKGLSGTWGKITGLAEVKSPWQAIAKGIGMGLDLINSTAEAEIEKEKTSRRMQVLAGGQAGIQLYENIHSSYLPTSIYGKEQYKYANDLLGSGDDVNNIVPDLKKIGDLAIGNDASFQRIKNVLQDVMEQQTFSKRDAALLKGTGFNAQQTLADFDPMHRGVDYWLGELGKTGIGLTLFRKAIDEATGSGGSFFQMQNKIAESSGEKIKLLQDRITNFAEDMPGLTSKMAEDLSKFSLRLNELWPTIEKFGSGLLDTLSPIKDLALSDSVKELIKNIVSLSTAIVSSPLLKQAVQGVADLTDGAVGVINNEINTYEKVWDYLFDGDAYDRKYNPHVMTSERTGYIWGGMPLGSKEAGFVVDTARMKFVTDSIGVGNFFPDKAAFDDFGEKITKVYYPKTLWEDKLLPLPIKRPEKKQEKKTKNSVRSTTDAIVNGGNRVININMNAPMYKVDHQVFQKAEDAVKDFEPKMKEALLRILYSVPAV